MTKDIENRLTKIEQRNKLVEQNKLWETSLTRRAAIVGLTYIVMLLFMFSAGIDRPFINAIIPSIGFTLSTLTISTLKNWWINNNSR